MLTVDAVTDRELSEKEHMVAPELVTYEESVQTVTNVNWKNMRMDSNDFCKVIIQLNNIVRIVSTMNEKLEPKELPFVHLMHGWTTIMDIKLPLHVATCRKSNVHGMGLFANHDLQEGDVISFYPVDAVIHVLPEHDDRPLYILGTRVMQQKLYQSPEKPGTFAAWMTENIFNLTDKIFISGCPTFHEDPAFLGHMCNDGAQWSKVDDERARVLYLTMSLAKQNARFYKFQHMVVLVACRDIAANEEIFTHYGETYWRVFKQPVAIDHRTNTVL